MPGTFSLRNDSVDLGPVYRFPLYEGFGKRVERRPGFLPARRCLARGTARLAQHQPRRWPSARTWRSFAY